MLRNSWPLLAAILLIAGAGEARAQRDPGAAANVRESQHYEQALSANPGFRAKRIAQECGPVSDPELHAQCVASFDGGGDTPARRRPRQR